MPASLGRVELYRTHWPSGETTGFSASTPSWVSWRAPLPSLAAVQISKLPVRFELQRSCPSRPTAGSQSLEASSVSWRTSPEVVEAAHRSRFPVRSEEKTIVLPSGEYTGCRSAERPWETRRPRGADDHST